MYGYLTWYLMPALHYICAVQTQSSSGFPRVFPSPALPSSEPQTPTATAEPLTQPQNSVPPERKGRQLEIQWHSDPDPFLIQEMAQKVYDTLLHNMDIQPTTLRLAFHDCVGPSCDGCININDQNNFGLEKAINVLEPVYLGNKYDQVISRADFWQLAGLAAIEIGIQENNSRCRVNDKRCWMQSSIIPFKVGRKDCDTSPQSSALHNFFKPTMSRSQMMQHFMNQFKLDDFEVTALMGAHSLGGAKTENSGYEGNWTQGELNKFDTKFFKMIVDKKLSFVNKPNLPNAKEDKKFQFEVMNENGTMVGFMLNTDVELAYDIDVNVTMGTKCIIHQSCKPTNTRPLVETYAENPGKFIYDFQLAYSKMIENGYDKLVEVKPPNGKGDGMKWVWLQ